jgi:hypothetical protein
MTLRKTLRSYCSRKRNRTRRICEKKQEEPTNLQSKLPTYSKEAKSYKPKNVRDKQTKQDNEKNP